MIFFDGGTPRSDRTVRMVDTISWMYCTSRSASASAHAASPAGNDASVTVGASPSRFGSFCQISSVMNGMNGCSSRISRSCTSTSTATAASRTGPGCCRSTFTNSMYQSANSCQKKW